MTPNKPQSKPKPQPSPRSTGRRSVRPAASGKKPSSTSGLSLKSSGTSREQAIRTQRRTKQLAHQAMDSIKQVNQDSKSQSTRPNIFGHDQLQVIFLGGQAGIGEKNMVVVEYGQEALIIDCGIELGLDLPGVNYSIPDTTYLETIKGKIKGYAITHGHLDHVGGLPHIISKYPAPVYGSKFTIGMVKKVLDNHPDSADIVDDLKFIEMNMDNHERLVVGNNFKLELVRITHSIPESSCVIVDTPVGRLVHTGDFRLDPEPLDQKPSDKARLEELGKQGVLLLLSESTNAQKPGRTPTEHTLQGSFHDVIKSAPGRIAVATFSSNLNRVQLIINSATEAGRKVAIDGRSMIQHIELAVKLGLLKVPKDTIVPVAKLASLEDNRILLMCTGGQGEPGAALTRMSTGEHKYINLRKGDTVVVSSNPIPGNEVAYEKLGNDLVKLGCRVFRNPTWEVDGVSGPLHVSGHAYQDEYREMIELVKPKFFCPIYAGPMNRKYHGQLAIRQAGMDGKDIFMANNGDTIIINDKLQAKLHTDVVPHGSVLVDDSGQPLPSVVIKDRLLMTETGLVVIVLVIDRRSGQLLSSPDIITRGFIHIRDNEELMNVFRNELRRAVQQRFKRVELDRFKAELKDHITHFLYDKTQRSPIVIPVINVVTSQKSATTKPSESPPTETTSAEQQRRFAELRASIRSRN